MPTYPGFHPEFITANYPPDIRTALRRIALHFYVTRSFRPVQIGNSDYYGALVRPTEEFSVYINTDREVLVLFALYETFEIRTLEAYQEFYALVESARIDKSIRFLISNDDRIEATIKHYLNQYPEYPIIVPATFQQLLNPSESSLLAAVRRNYLLRDLFGYQNPLREETFFFGRQFVVNNVLDKANRDRTRVYSALEKVEKRLLFTQFNAKQKDSLLM